MISLRGDSHNLKVANKRLNGSIFRTPEKRELLGFLEDTYTIIHYKLGVSAHIDITIYFVSDKQEVINIHGALYPVRLGEFDSIAFCSLSTNSVYVSAKNVTSRVIRHEFGHLLFQAMCKDRPRSRVHECVAQFCEL